MKFCNLCGQATVIVTPEGDNIERPFCPECKTIHYENPGVMVSCIVDLEGTVLLTKNSSSQFSIPHSFMRHSEGLADAAVRALATTSKIKPEKRSMRLWFVNTDTGTNQVNVVFRIKRSKVETDQTNDRLVSEKDCLGENVDEFSKSLLGHYFSERSSGKFMVHLEHLTRAIS